MAPHRHQVSLERILDFSTQPRSLAPNRRAQARTKFNSITSHFNTPHDRSVTKYNRPLLIRYTYEYARSELSQDMFLSAFLDLLGVSINGQAMDFGDRELEEDLRELLIQFADLFIDNLFLPCLSHLILSSPISDNTLLTCSSESNWRAYSSALSCTSFSCPESNWWGTRIYWNTRPTINTSGNLSGSRPLSMCYITQV